MDMMGGKDLVVQDPVRQCSLTAWSLMSKGILLYLIRMNWSWIVVVLVNGMGHRPQILYSAPGKNPEPLPGSWMKKCILPRESMAAWQVDPPMFTRSIS